jgi:tRNA (guanine37-N1)-methyltransferase
MKMVKVISKKRKPKKFTVISLFPQVLEAYARESLMKRATDAGLIEVRTVNLRDFGEGVHKQVDDKPFGGGSGMVIMVDPVRKALQSISKKKSEAKKRVILFSTRGKKFDVNEAKRLLKYDELIFICGRYEGVDERVAEHLADEELSIGDFVLSGGELPALVVIEAISRFIPGFLGKFETLEENKGSFPTYTRPASYKVPGAKKSWDVPEVLISGNHAHIAQWRKEQGGPQKIAE